MTNCTKILFYSKDFPSPFCYPLRFCQSTFIGKPDTATVLESHLQSFCQKCKKGFNYFPHIIDSLNLKFTAKGLNFNYTIMVLFLYTFLEMVTSVCSIIAWLRLEYVSGLRFLRIDKSPFTSNIF